VTGRLVPTFAPSTGEVLTLGGLQERLHGVIQATPHVDPLAVALSVIDISQTIQENDIATPENRPVFTLATALLVALRELQRPYPYLNTPSTPFMEAPEIAERLATDAEGVFSDSYVAFVRPSGPSDPLRTREELRLNAIWMLADNLIFQGDMLPRLGAALVLTGLAGFRRLRAEPDQTNGLFSRRLGVSAYDYVLVTLAIWAVSRGRPLIELPLLRDGPPREEVERDTRKVVAMLARRADQMRDLSDAPTIAAYSGKSLPSALFQRWPLVQLNENQFLVSAPPFLKVQLTSKFLTKALAFARLESSPAERGRTPYSAFVGQQRFEPFVRELCDLWCPGQHFDEYEYLRSGNQRSADRIVFERHGRGEVAILLQMKLKMVLEATHFGATADALTTDLGSALSETVYKSIQFLAALAKAEASGSLRPEFSPDPPVPTHQLDRNRSRDPGPVHDERRTTATHGGS
jgi:hypothetical protein